MGKLLLDKKSIWDLQIRGLHFACGKIHTITFQIKTLYFPSQVITNPILHYCMDGQNSVTPLNFTLFGFYSTVRYLFLE